VGFGARTAWCGISLSIRIPFARALGRDVRRIRADAMTAWARNVAGILGLRVVVLGPVPKAPFVLVSNHLGYVDVIVLASQAPIAFVAKAEIEGWPFFGTLGKLVGTIFIDRARGRDIPRVIAEMEEAFHAGLGVVVFPEATSSEGREVLRFRPSLLEAAAAGKLPVVPAALSYRTPPGEVPAHVAVSWGDATPFVTHVTRLLEVESFEARVRFGATAVVEEDRKELAARLQEAVSTLFEPTAPANVEASAAVPGAQI